MVRTNFDYFVSQINTSIGKNGFFVVDLPFGIIYLLFYLKLIFYLILNLYLKDCIVIILFLYYILVDVVYVNY